jgi:hypothetical protein
MQFAIEAGHVLTFARAIGIEPAEIGEVAPPTFGSCSAQHDADHMRGMRPAGAVAEAMAGNSTVLHAEQSFEYFSPVRVGDVLDVTEFAGRNWTKLNKAGEVLAFSELIKEFRDPAGALVLRSRMVLVTLP